MSFTILFKRTPRAYLPEVTAYKAFLARHHKGVESYEALPGEKYNPLNYDVIWNFMGLDFEGQGRYVVHEYNSLSTGRSPHLKNALKRFCNARPDARIFLNSTVRAGFPFLDGIPYFMRDMGVNDMFFRPRSEPEYDFVYAGSLDRGNDFTATLDRFLGPLSGRKVLLIGNAPLALRERYRANSNIIFTGQVPYNQVPELVAKARFGLNLMPDLYPFNRQTATKVLEYCALGMPVISTRYKWIEAFQKSRNANFFWLDANSENLTEENLQGFDFQTPDVEDLRWDSIIEKSEIFNFLKTRQN